MELQRNLDAIRQQGLGLAAISYDSVAVLKNFTDRQHIKLYGRSTTSLQHGKAILVFGGLYVSNIPSSMVESGALKSHG